MFARFPLVAAAAATLVMATGAASADGRSAVLIAKPKPQQMVLIAPKRVGIFCPEGWVQATPPLNWQLGCLPNTLTLGN